MYNEERNYFFRDVIVKVILVLLFVFLLIWLFPMPNLNPVYDRIFGENIKTMSKAARDYFTIERLPQNEGDKEVITLEEMLKNKMIVPFVDSDNKTCDIKNSFVEVIKMENEFLFKTTLSCSNKTDYVIEYFGCYDICGDACAVKPNKNTVTQYEFYKETTKKVVDSYTCPKDYKLEGTVCIKSSTQTDTKKPELVCSKDYTYNSKDNVCEKTVKEEKEATKTCTTGYVYNSKTDKCEKTVGETVNANRTCPTGYTYDSYNNTCQTVNVITKNADLTCEKGYTYDNSNQSCKKDLNEIIAAVITCPIGYSVFGTKCGKEVPEVYDADAICNTGFVMNYKTNKCEKTGTTTTYSEWVCTEKIYNAKQPVYTYELSKRIFIKSSFGYGGCTSNCAQMFYTYDECSRTASYKTGIVATEDPIGYSCPLGKQNSDKKTCTTTKIEYTSATYKCPTGYNGKVEGNKCYYTITDVKTPNYSCSTGYTLSGTTCYQSVYGTTTPTYSCSTGYILSGTTCSKTGTDTKTPNYSCSTGYTLSGTKCSKTTIDKKSPTMSCSTGYTLSGKDCVKSTTQKDTKQPEVKYKDVTSKEYKWSSNKTLDGWKETGKTRLVEV